MRATGGADDGSGGLWRQLILVVGVGLVLVGGLTVVVAVGLGEGSRAGRASASAARPQAELAAETSLASESVTVQIQPDGTAEVAIRIRPGKDVAALVVGPPREDDGRQPPVVRDLNLTVGRAVVARAVDLGRSTRRFTFASGPEIDLDFTLADVSDLSPHRAGRALLRATSASLTYDHRASVRRVSVSGGEVLSLSCGRAMEVPGPCGGPVKSGWSVVLRGESLGDRVRAQVNLG